jgi:flagellar basal-body rod modification protein FlgD
MTSPNPITGTTPPASGTTTTNSNNTLGPNSFITLLTAQLQAQDPLSPMDPDQMVNELTSINSLQQLVQISSDMNTLVGALPAGQTSTGNGSGSDSPAAARAANLASITNSVAPAAAKLNYVVNSQINSQLNSSSQSF